MNFKYVVFRGRYYHHEYKHNATIVATPMLQVQITVGAVLYSNTRPLE